ncbi:hypothetical protein ABIQ69_07470 [Agromyces sp. G08B096]|uniref:Uncharacterized protein n=1 Tax=Agromyces sp. G08B096 TaxID=3156399 RepID=A0AAU7WA11_9MICO
MTADAPGPVPVPGDGAGLTDAQRALRAQLLATEHWSLLASRSTTQSEVLTRIAIFLTLVSAGLVTLGVLGQATGFRGWFGVAALGVLLLLCLLGYVTALRVFNTGTEDLMYVVAMNRLRGAYLDLDPGLAPYLLMSPADDEAGSRRTYHYFGDRGSGSQVLASSMMLIALVQSAVTGLLAGGIAAALGGATWLAVTIGAAVALLLLVLWLVRGYRSYRDAFRMHEPLRRSR